MCSRTFHPQESEALSSQEDFPVLLTLSTEVVFRESHRGQTFSLLEYLIQSMSYIKILMLFFSKLVPILLGVKLLMLAEGPGAEMRIKGQPMHDARGLILKHV